MKPNRQNGRINLLLVFSTNIQRYKSEREFTIFEKVNEYAKFKVK